MKIALAHDYLVSLGGAERVLRAMLEIWPEADVYTAVAEIQSVSWRTKFKIPSDKLHFPVFSKLPLFGRFYKFFTFFYPLVFESFDLSAYDVVISSSSNFAKGVITGPNQLNICYCHTVPRFLWGYPTETNWRQNPILGPILAPLDSYLRVWDFWAAQRVDYFVANSQTVAERIRKFYRRDATVIYPPVELEARGQPARRSLGEGGEGSPPAVVLAKAGRAGGQEYYLVVSRLSAYKNVHLAIEASKRKGFLLKIVGSGREEKNLKKLAQDYSQIEFLGEASDSDLSYLYANCKAVICPTQDEDFGIVPVEAMSFGKAVVALQSGGYKETVIEGKTGLFFEKTTVESLISAIERFEANLDFYQNQEFQKNASSRAQNFSKEKFQENFKSFVEEKYIQRKNSSKT